MYFLHKTSDRLPRKPLHILRTVMRFGTLQVTWTRSVPLKNAHLWSVTEGCNVHKKKCSSGHQKGKSRRSSGLLFSLQYILTLRILNNWLLTGNSLMSLNKHTGLLSRSLAKTRPVPQKKSVTAVSQHPWAVQYPDSAAFPFLLYPRGKQSL